ncbi:HAMP domain-containing histidine kinase, partial [bacterium]|nr:HAMP domain-containing histidine kinase [bacterium]
FLSLQGLEIIFDNSKVFLDTTAIKTFAQKKYPNFEVSFKQNTELANSIQLTIRSKVLAELEDKLHRRWVMFVSESSFFVLMILIGIFQIYKSFKTEVELNKRQQNFLLSITHELKSPLASIKLYLETILFRDLKKEQISQFVSNSLIDIERLNDLVENMLIAAKIENNAYTYPKENFNLSETVNESVEKFRKILPENAELTEKIQGEIIFLGDKFTLTSVLANLLENALKYSGKNAKITIELFTEEKGIALVVSDNGVGIPKNEKNKIFEKFYRIGNEKTRSTKGTGLGLYIVKEVVKEHEGKIFVCNNFPEGTVFKVVFPKNKGIL